MWSTAHAPLMIPFKRPLGAVDSTYAFISGYIYACCICVFTCALFAYSLTQMSTVD
jgi:hypothetical protein